MYSGSVLRKNHLVLFFYLLLITAIILILGYYITEVLGLGINGIIITGAIAAVFNFVSYYFSDTLVIKSTKAFPIDQNAYADYVELVKDMCARNNIEMPRLYMINSRALNAFATGRDKKHAVVTVTKGLLEKLTPNEVRGVVAHELSHIQNGDILIMSAVAILASFITVMTSVFRYRSVYRGKNSSGANVIAIIVIAIIAPIIATLIKLAVSRSREYGADARGGEICGNPNFLADALYKIKTDGMPLETASETSAHLFIANPLKADFLANLMSTHPDIDDRIMRLRKMVTPERI